MSKVNFLIGVGVGYVLGARAGRDRYDAILRQARTVKERPEVQEAAGVVTAQAGSLVSKVKGVVGSRAGRVGGGGGGGESYVEHVPGQSQNGTGGGS